jgi:hypothetical protein
VSDGVIDGAGQSSEVVFLGKTGRINISLPNAQVLGKLTADAILGNTQGGAFHLRGYSNTSNDLLTLKNISGTLKFGKLSSGSQPALFQLVDGQLKANASLPSAPSYFVTIDGNRSLVTSSSATTEFVLITSGRWHA